LGAVTDDFVEFVHGLKLEDAPAGVRNAATLALLDWLGVTLAGSRQPLAGILAAAMAPLGGEPQAVLIGRGAAAPAPTAALVNGAAAHALDFDDYLADGLLHGSAPLAAALLALAQWRGRSGRDLAEAYLAGYETQAHLSLRLGRPLILRGFHPTGVLCRFGVAAGAGKLLGLGPQRLREALGIAGVKAAGLLQSFGTMSKPLHSGTAAMDGVHAALWAEAGYTGPPEVFDGDRGFAAVYVQERLEGAADELGRRWLLADNAIKPYAACGAVHAALDAALALAPETDGADAIEGVVCEVSDITCHSAGIAEPRSGLEAKFSTAYAVAAALATGAAPPETFEDEAVAQPEVRQLLARVELVPAYERITQARVCVRLVDGRALERAVDWAKGSPENPMSRSDVEAKFREIAVPLIGQERALLVIELARRLESLTDVGGLAGLCGGRAPEEVAPT